MKITLSQFKESINAGYLPINWRERIINANQLVLTYHGYIAIDEDTITTEDEGNTYHEENDNDNFAWDEYKEEYIEEENTISAYGYRGREIYTHRNNCVEVGRNNYVIEFLSENDIVTLANGDYCHLDDACYVEDEGEYYHTDEVYYWESDECYHLEPEGEEAQINTLWSYSGGPQEKNYVNEDAEEGKIKFGFGIEIEKNDMPNFDFNRNEIYEQTGAVLEKDSSVNRGFELKTPVYNLMSAKTEERLQPLKPFADIKNVENAGGHIGFSMEGKDDKELLNLCRGFLPLIYAMYKKRIDNHYCQAKPVNKLQEENEKFQSIRLRGNYIEFRIFSSVKSYNTILFRLNFFRIMAQNLGASFNKVITQAVTTGTPLHALLVSDVYKDVDKLERLINDAVQIDKTLGTNKITEKTINKIGEELKKLKANINQAQEVKA
jgi:hypothetical protein